MFNDVKNSLNRSIDELTPNTIDPLRNALNNKGKQPFIRSKKKVFPTKLSIILATLIMAIVIQQLPISANASSTITLDVNPSISITCDHKGNIIEINSEQQYDVKNKTVNEAVQLIMEDFIQQGYLNKEHNSILLNVSGEDNKQNKKIEEMVTETVQKAPIDIALVIVDKIDEKTKQLMDDYQITSGRAIMIQEMMSDDPTLTIEQLLSLTVHQLNVLASKKQLPTIEKHTTGQVNQSEYISLEQAKEIATKAFNIAPTSGCEVEYDSDNGRLIIEVECGNNEIEIDAITKEIITIKKEEIQKQETHTDYLTIALNAFQLQNNNIIDIDIDTDDDEIEVSFKQNNNEYEVKIDKNTNTIISKKIGSSK